MEILSKKAIGINELRGELEKVKKRDKELNFRATRAEEYLQHFASLKNWKDLFKKIEALKVPRLKEEHIVKIVDILPKNVEDLKNVLKAYPITINNENLKKIVDTVAKFTAEK